MDIKFYVRVSSERNGAVMAAKKWWKSLLIERKNKDKTERGYMPYKPIFRSFFPDWHESVENNTLKLASYLLPPPGPTSRNKRSRLDPSTMITFDGERIEAKGFTALDSEIVTVVMAVYKTLIYLNMECPDGWKSVQIGGNKAACNILAQKLQLKKKQWKSNDSSPPAPILDSGPDYYVKSSFARFSQEPEKNGSHPDG